MALVGAPRAAGRAALAGTWSFERRWASTLLRSVPMRAVAMTGFAVAGLHVALMLGVDDDRARIGTFRRALIGLTCVAALGAWALSASRGDELRRVLTQLLSLRGFGAQAATPAPAIGATVLLARVMLPPFAVLSAVRLGLAPNLSAVARVVADVAGAFFYVVVCAGAFCAVALAARSVAPDRGRLVYFVLVVAPLSLSIGFDVPHVAGMLSALLDLCVPRGAAG